MNNQKTSGQAMIEYIIVSWVIIASLILFFDLPAHFEKSLMARQSQVESYLSQHKLTKDKPALIKKGDINYEQTIKNIFTQKK